MLIGLTSDSTLSYFFSACKEAGRNVVWASPEDIEADVISASDFVSCLQAASGVYYRDADSWNSPFRSATPFITAMLSRVNNVIAPSNRSTNWSKPLHSAKLSLISQGTRARIPHTRIISSNAQLQSGIVKSMSAPSYCFKVASKNLDHYGPMLWQEHIDGEEWRVHIIDGKIVAHRLIKGPGTDYRLSGLKDVKPVDLAAWETNALLQIARSEGGRLVGIDLIRQDLNMVILEVNPMPGWECYERWAGVGRPISDLLFSSLMKSDRNR